GGRGARVRARDVGWQRAVLDRLTGEGQARDAVQRDLGRHAAPVHRYVAGLPVPLDGVRRLAAEQAVQREERGVLVLSAQRAEARLADPSSPAAGRALL